MTFLLILHLMYIFPWKFFSLRIFLDSKKRFPVKTYSYCIKMVLTPVQAFLLAWINLLQLRFRYGLNVSPRMEIEFSL